MVGAGFAWADVQTFTLAQIEALLAAIDDERKGERRLDLIIARAAQAKADHFKKVLREFS